MGNASVAEGVEVRDTDWSVVDGDELWFPVEEPLGERTKDRRTAMWMMLICFTLLICIAAAAWVTQR